MNYFRVLFFIMLFGLLNAANCKGPEPEPDVLDLVQIKINHLFNGQSLQIDSVYKSPQGRNMWVSKKKYYLSNIIGTTTNGKEHLINDIVLIEAGEESKEIIEGIIPIGNYKSITFDLGVREDLNLKDPATFKPEHPLSVMNNMYWNWSTQYIFSKFEGKEINGSDTNSFFIHTGTQNLYRPSITIKQSFEVKKGGTEISIYIDIYSILSHADYTFDLSQDGQSHTTDNLDLAVHYMDNFATAFE